MAFSKIQGLHRKKAGDRQGGYSLYPILHAADSIKSTRKSWSARRSSPCGSLEWWAVLFRGS